MGSNTNSLQNITSSNFVNNLIDLDTERCPFFLPLKPCKFHYAEKPYI